MKKNFLLLLIISGFCFAATPSEIENMRNSINSHIKNKLKEVGRGIREESKGKIDSEIKSIMKGLVDDNKSIGAVQSIVKGGVDDLVKSVKEEVVKSIDTDAIKEELKSSLEKLAEPFEGDAESLINESLEGITE